ncbi:hypothetical protein LCGC14_2752320, partial [marine sediment metagenome]
MAFLSKENYNPEEYLLDTLNDLDIGFVKVSNDGIILNHNLTFNKIFGYNPEKNLINTKILDYWLNSEEINSFREELFKNGIVKKYIAPAKKLDGEKIFLQMNIKLNKNSNGEIISSERSFTDVTKRIRTEQQLKESEEKLKKFMDSATDSFTLFDAKVNYVDFNKKSETMFGLNKEEVIGKNILDILPNLKETGRYDKYLEVIKTGKPFFIDDFIPHPRFGDIHLAMSAFKVSDGLGIIATDISERKKIEQKLRLHNEIMTNLAEGVHLIRADD